MADVKISCNIPSEVWTKLNRFPELRAHGAKSALVRKLLARYVEQRIAKLGEPPAPKIDVEKLLED